MVINKNIIDVFKVLGYIFFIWLLLEVLEKVIDDIYGDSNGSVFLVEIVQFCLIPFAFIWFISKHYKSIPEKFKAGLFGVLILGFLLLFGELIIGYSFYQNKLSKGKPASVNALFRENEYTIFKRIIRLRESQPNQTVESEKYFKTLDRNFKYKYKTDQNGFIEPSEIHEDPDLKIVFMGGSTTFCKMVEEKKRFPYLAGRIIESQSGLKINAINSGVEGNNSMHSLNLLVNKILPLSPDYVVLMHNINDLIVIHREEDYWNNCPEHSLTIDQNSWLTMKEWNKQRKKDFNVDRSYDRVLGLFSKSIRTFVKVCKVWGIKPVLMTQANRFTNEKDNWISNKAKSLEAKGIDYEKYILLYHRLNQEIRLIAKQENVALIDLAQKIPQKSKYIYDFVHLDIEGSELAAKIISEKFLSVLQKDEK